MEVRGNVGGFAQKIVVDPHQLTADEPKDMGLDDEGSTPYDSLLAALGLCTSMDVAPYAQCKDPPLQGITARLRHTRICGIYATDRAECETKEGKIDRIGLGVAYRVTLKGCPNHRSVRVLVPADGKMPFRAWLSRQAGPTSS
ncbi:MAG: hypothetical protein M3305_04595 [Actinomycetota bacterium]|nr:hypothetical protein [Actinomycetota bacterium]